jgi:hypothetical protein
MNNTFSKLLTLVSLALCNASVFAQTVGGIAGQQTNLNPITSMDCAHVRNPTASLYPTETIVGSVTGSPGVDVEITGHIKFPLPGKPLGQVNVLVAGKTVGSAQTGPGYTFRYRVPQELGVGTFPVEVRFLPTGNCAGSTGSSTLTIIRGTPRLERVGAVEQPAGRITASAEFSSTVKGQRNIEFLIDGKPFGTASTTSTDYSSLVNFSGALPAGASPNSQVTARFAGDSLLNPVSVSKTIDFIKNKIASLRVESGRVILGSTSNIRVSLRTAELTGVGSNGPLANETIEAYLIFRASPTQPRRTSLKATAVTDANGGATLTIALPWPDMNAATYYSRAYIALKVQNPNVQIVGGEVEVPL